MGDEVVTDQEPHQHPVVDDVLEVVVIKYLDQSINQYKNNQPIST